MGGGVLRRNANGGLPTVLIVWRDVGVGTLSRRYGQDEFSKPTFFPQVLLLF